MKTLTLGITTNTLFLQTILITGLNTIECGLVMLVVLRLCIETFIIRTFHVGSRVSTAHPGGIKVLYGWKITKRMLYPLNIQFFNKRITWLLQIILITVLSATECGIIIMYLFLRLCIENLSYKDTNCRRTVL